MAKLTQNKNIKNNYLEYLFAQQNATNNNRNSPYNDFFRKNKVNETKNKQNRKKRKPNRLGSDFLKK